MTLPLMAEDKNADKKLAMKFIHHLRDGQFKEGYAMFDQSVQTMFTQQQLQNIWEDLVRENGFFEKITLFREDRDTNYTIIYVSTSFLRKYADFTVSINNNQKIIGFRILKIEEKADLGYPPYADSSNIISEDHVFDIKGWKLQAKLTLPRKNQDKLPVVILIHGSGPQDMDQSIGKLKPFRDMAYGLTTKGIAVFRYNKRTTDHPFNFMKLPTFTIKEEATDDVIEAIEFLKRDPRIDTNKIFLKISTIPI